MSIKGTTKELFVGKEEINLITFIGNKITIPYSVMKGVIIPMRLDLKPDFCYLKEMIILIYALILDTTLMKKSFRLLILLMNISLGLKQKNLILTNLKIIVQPH